MHYPLNRNPLLFTFHLELICGCEGIQSSRFTLQKRSNIFSIFENVPLRRLELAIVGNCHYGRLVSDDGWNRVCRAKKSKEEFDSQTLRRAQLQLFPSLFSSMPGLGSYIQIRHSKSHWQMS